MYFNGIQVDFPVLEIEILGLESLEYIIQTLEIRFDFLYRFCLGYLIHCTGNLWPSAVADMFSMIAVRHETLGMFS